MSCETQPHLAVSHNVHAHHPAANTPVSQDTAAEGSAATAHEEEHEEKYPEGYPETHIKTLLKNEKANAETQTVLRDTYAVDITSEAVVACCRGMHATFSARSRVLHVVRPPASLLSLAAVDGGRSALAVQLVAMLKRQVHAVLFNLIHSVHPPRGACVNC